MSTADRIAALRAEGEAAVAAAPSTAELEEVRVRFLGRKAELPNLLRDVGKLPPEERGAVGSGANEARQALEAAVDARRGELEAVELEQSLAADVVDVTLPGSPVPAPGHLHMLTATRREIEDVFIGLGFRVVEGPEIDLAYYNFDALNHDANHPARSRGRHVLRRRRRRPAHPDLADAGARDGAARPPLYIIVPGRVYRRDNDATHTPQFHQVEGLAVDEDITLGDLQGTLLAFARAIFGDDREVRLRPHFFPFTEPSVELDVSCFNCSRASCATARAARCARARPGSRSSAPAWSTRTSTATCASPATTPSATRASPGAWASSGSRSSSTACPTCACSSRTTCGSWSNSDENTMGRHDEWRCRAHAERTADALPLFWLNDYVDPRLGVAELAERLDMTGTEVERMFAHGVAALDNFVVGRVLTPRATPTPTA